MRTFCATSFAYNEENLLDHKYDNMEEKISFFKSSVKSLSSFVC